MSKIKKVFSIIVFTYLIIFTVWFVVTTNRDLEKSHISDFNTMQLELAKQTAKNVETYFNLLSQDLAALAKAPEIIELDNRGKTILEIFQKTHKHYIAGVTRINSDGKISFTTHSGNNVLGKNVLNQEHNKTLFRTHKPIVSDMLRVLQGFDAILFSYPIFKGSEFKGALTLLMPFRKISERFFGSISIGKSGYAWVLNEKGTEIYCPVKGYAGKSIFETTDNYPSIINLAKRMMAGESGTTTYQYNKIRNDKTTKITRFAAFTNIKLPGTTWSVVISTPKSQILSQTKKSKNRWILFLVYFGAGITLMAYLMVDAFLIVSIQKKQRKAEESLSVTEQNFKSILEYLPIGLVVVETDGTISMRNKKGFEISGYNPGEYKNIKELISTVSPDLKTKKLWYSILETCKGEQGNKSSIIKSVETSIKTKNGKIKYVMLTGKSIRDKFIITIEDITERKTMEQVEKEMQKKIQRSKKMEAIGMMAGGVAHDLNNILSGIVAYPDLILMDLEEDSPIAESIYEIQSAGKGAADLVSDLLTATRGIAVKKEIRDATIIIETCSKSPQIKNLQKLHPLVKFKLKDCEEKLPIFCSPTHINKSVMNLITNAFESVEDRVGEVIIGIKSVTLNKTIEGYDSILPGKYVVISVSDTGSGISEKDQERIFEPFYSKKIMGRSGTGLGLAIVWSTIRDHKGYVDLISSPKGTSFLLYLPQKEQTNIITDDDRELFIIDGKGISVLVVDDQLNPRLLAERLLNKMGFKVNSVDSGEKAIEFIEKQTVDLVLLDMIMEPGISGLETYQNIISIYPDQKAIIVSGYAQSDDVVKAISLGVNSYLQKPYVVNDFVNVLKSVLNL
jgi:PAS domain S-box-containing protein